jgi:hypothetical protein
MNILTAKRRVMAVGCSHGSRANADALAAALLFRDAFDPHEVIHLGDAYDLASLRAGSIGNDKDPDSVDDYERDIDSGIEFLDALRPTVFCCGNHDLRAEKYRHHHNAVIRGFAQLLWDRMMEPVKRHAHTVIEYNDVHDRSWYHLGGYRWGHGVLFGEQFLRDSAESFGNCVIAHAHRAGMARGRTSEASIALSPGTLANVGAMDYAAKRRSTLSWSHGVVFGWYSDDSAELLVHQWPQGEVRWALPNF